MTLLRASRKRAIPPKILSFTHINRLKIASEHAKRTKDVSSGCGMNEVVSWGKGSSLAI